MANPDWTEMSKRTGASEPVEADALMREEPDIVFFRACHHGPLWRHQIHHYAGLLKSRHMEWPDWLPHKPARDLAPLVSSVHRFWPEGDAGKVKAAQRVAVIAYRGRDVAPLRVILRRAGWVDVTDLWRAAVEARAAALKETSMAASVKPLAEVGPLEPVGEVVTRQRVESVGEAAKRQQARRTPSPVAG